MLLDRQQGARENLRKVGVRLHAFATIRQIADKLVALGTIDETQHNEIVGQIVT